MKCSIPEISWHNREPVLSVDIQVNNSNNDFLRLATGGSDNFVLVWKLKRTHDGRIDVTILSELTRHQRSVNVVKWSPNGDLLASGDDDANIILWHLKTDNIPSLDEHENDFEERWNVYKVLRGHKEDVYDLCWSPKCDKLLSGSVDNTAILWDVAKGKTEHIITDHKGFVQGVAWDPKSDYIATLCSDRVCRVFDRNGRRVRSRIGRGVLPVSETNELYSKEVKYFHDDTFKTYFRRLSFTPDGSLLLVPSGAVESDEKKNILYGTFAFTMDSFNRPVCILPSGKKCSIVVKCSPVLYELREKGPKPIVDLPYRMIIAVATDSDVILYDTQQLAPCVHLQNIHYTRLTDLTWSSDGLLLAASSTDGFITLVTFEEEELGVKYIEKEIEDVVNLNISNSEELPRDDVVETPVEVEKPRKPSFLEQWAKQAPKRKIDNPEGDTDKTMKKLKGDGDAIILIDSVNESSNNVQITQEVNKLAENSVECKKKRITPTLVSKPEKGLNKEMKPAIVDEIKPKKRIQPLKIGDVTNETSKRNVNTTKAEFSEVKPVETENSKNHIEILFVDDAKMPAPSTPNKIPETSTSKDNEKIVTSTIPISKNKTSPQDKSSTPNNPPSKGKSSSSKKKKTTTPLSNTLLNYLKPVPKTAKSSEDAPRSEFKPQKLFDLNKTEVVDSEITKGLVNVESNTSSCPEISKPEVKTTIKKSTSKSLIIVEDSKCDKVKVKTSNLIKRKAEIKKISDSSKVPKDNEENTITEMPDDFVLQVEESPQSNSKIEKENELMEIDENNEISNDIDKSKEPECVDKPLNHVKQCDVTIKVEAKQPRRIPLITLSSPKNKKKKPVE